MLGVDKIRRPAAARTHPLANALMLVLGAGLVYIAASRAAAENATALKPGLMHCMPGWNNASRRRPNAPLSHLSPARGQSEIGDAEAAVFVD